MSDGSGLTLLTSTSANDAWESWSPDGNQIAFFSDRDGGQAALYIMNADGSDQTHIQAKASRAVSPPVWLPHFGAARATVGPTLQAPPTPALALLPQPRQRIAFVSGQGDEAGVEEAHILSESFGAVACRIDRDEQDLHPLCIISQHLPRLRESGQRGRTHIGAMRVAEHQHDDLAGEILQTGRLSLLVCQGEITADTAGLDRVGIERYRAGG